MESSERLKWPASFKESVVFGVGLIALEGTYIGLQAAGVIPPTVLENITGAVFGLAGGWRIAEPFIMMHDLRNRHQGPINQANNEFVE